MRLPNLSELESAAAIVHKYMPPTPQYNWPLLSERCGCEFWLKHENHTPVGAFKVRGGLVYLDRLRREYPEVKGIVSATRGNHGQSLAFAARCFGLRATLIVPVGNSVEKNRAMRGLGAELIEHGGDFHEADHYADKLAQESKLHRVSSFDSILVTGVGSYALELFRVCPNLDAVYVSIGWGSGACGLAAAKRALGLKTAIIGVVSKQAPTTAVSFERGEITEVPSKTVIADGIATSHPHELAFPTLREELERVVQVGDDEIERAMAFCFQDTHNVAEGAGAAPIAAVLQETDFVRDKKVAAILTGGNVDSERFAQVLQTTR